MNNTAPPPPPGDRIAKVLSRAGVASRRDAERMITAGRVRVNGQQIDSPALNVTAADLVEVDGKPIAAAEAPRVWLYHKPAGLVTSARDEKGRPTVFDALPEDMPRVMSVGRLDLNSEGLLILTNDGGLKRQMELPATGWLRRYRVRVHGTPQERDLEPLRKGVVIEGERFAPMEVALDRQQGRNAWITVGLREGKNREIRRAMESVGLVVNRLIRTSYGPFQLGNLPQGAVEELRARVVRDQLGLDGAEAPRTRSRAQKSGGGAQGKAARAGGTGPGKTAGRGGTAPGKATRSSGAASGKSTRHSPAKGPAGAPKAKRGPAAKSHGDGTRAGSDRQDPQRAAKTSRKAPPKPPRGKS